MPTTTGDSGWSFTVTPSADAGVVTYTYAGPDSSHTFDARVFGQRPDGSAYFAGGDLHVGNVAATPQDEAQDLSSSSDTLYRVVIYDLTTSHTVLEYDVVAGWALVATPYTAPVKWPQADSAQRWDGWDVFGQVGLSVSTKQVVIPHDPETALRHWGGIEDGSGDYLPGTIGAFVHQRSAPVTIVQEALVSAATELEAQSLHLHVTRHWAGIGGFLYVPSFPQLTRHETTWPFAR